MRFGIFYEHQLPKPWHEGDEARLFHQALEQVVLADRLGYDYAWEVEHHFLEEYSHSSAPEVFLAACAALTRTIRVGHGIRQVIPNYNHPARTAEGLATLDIVSRGRLDFGIGEGATRLELGGFGIPAREKRALALEAAEQIANMKTMSPYPGYAGKGFSFPCRNVVPKPVQKPHPPMWMACTNRDTIKVAAQNGIGALAFAFVNPEEARNWAEIYYGIIKSDSCVPLGHAVNANIAMVSNFSVHADRAEAIRRGQEGFEFFGYAVNALVAHDAVPGRSRLFEDFQKSRARQDDEIIAATRGAARNASGIGTPDDIREHIAAFQAAGVDQVIFLQQAGRNRHDHICESLELFAGAVMPGFKAEVGPREAKKAAELAPYIAAAMARKTWMKPLADDEIPVVKASVQRAQINAETR
ncbi:MAG TPA: LLM class flavin-dependent oxidoreductase [Rhizomicrobium sp.]|jgi:alkanesulfonate monooxygenase SsuD/methylene tetrahydromethanopterin reductase-like flavin-dependent oxidoreductase (luciferase family)|nr:LLM class flavin-dependent oxidoreductase [Rhizomicrobium sp.]